MKNGEKIRYLRENRFGSPITQDDLSHNLNLIGSGLKDDNNKAKPFSLIKNALSRYETGKIEVSNFDLVYAVCRFFEVPANYFIPVEPSHRVKLFELNEQTLRMGKIQLQRIENEQIDSEVIFYDDYICEEFAVKIPISSEMVYNTRMDYLLMEENTLRPFFSNFMYLRIKFMKSDLRSRIVLSNRTDIPNGSYLVYMIERKEIGIYEKLLSNAQFYYFKDGDVISLGEEIKGDYFYIGLISSEEVIIENEENISEIHNEAIGKL